MPRDDIMTNWETKSLKKKKKKRKDISELPELLDFSLQFKGKKHSNFLQTLS